jgi:hypothetical protein
VEIPGGALLLVEGEPRIPFYSVHLEYPAGHEIQDVALAERAGLTTATGLNVPIVTLTVRDGEEGSSAASTGWYPEEEYDWRAFQNPDGTTSLIIIMYPFYYNPLTTDVQFYKNYSFNITYTVATVEITRLETDEDAYRQGDQVAVDVGLNNAGEAEDVIFNAAIKRYSTGEAVDGLLLRSLQDLIGPASFSPRWDSSGFEPDYYYVEVTLQDNSSNVLDRQTEMFRLGIISGETTTFTATPTYFDIGDSINVSLVFSNTGTVNITGTAVIRVQDKAGETVQEFWHDVTDLAPGNAVSLDDAWDTSGAEEGTYSILGYVLYDSMATDPMAAVVSTEARIYLPVILKTYS